MENAIFSSFRHLAVVNKYIRIYANDGYKYIYFLLFTQFFYKENSKFV
jgi:hypothetical protein